MIDPFEHWQEQAACAKPANRDKIELFFSNKKADQRAAKDICWTCPVMTQCIKSALENKHIEGVWGGLDSRQIRRTLSVNWDGQEIRRKRSPKCPSCDARTLDLITKTVERPNGGRWATMRVVECTDCGFEWQSRTSANAVDAYHAQRAERMIRAEKDIAKKRAASRRKKAASAKKSEPK